MSCASFFPLFLLSSKKNVRKEQKKCQQQSNTSKRKRPRASTRASAASSSNTRVTSFSITRIGINGGRLRVRRKDVRCCSLFEVERSKFFSISLIFSLRLLLSFSRLNVVPRTRGVVVSAFDWSEERRGMLVRRALLCFLLLRFLSF